MARRHSPQPCCISADHRLWKTCHAHFEGAHPAQDAIGVEVPTSCKQGVCGTCLTRVLEGKPDHKDRYSTPDEQAANDQFTPCCSRAKTPRLVLDL